MPPALAFDVPLPNLLGVPLQWFASRGTTDGFVWHPLARAASRTVAQFAHPTIGPLSARSVSGLRPDPQARMARNENDTRVA